MACAFLAWFTEERGLLSQMLWTWLWFLMLILKLLSAVSQSVCTELPENTQALCSFQLEYPNSLNSFGSEYLHKSLGCKMCTARPSHDMPKVLKQCKYGINTTK